MRPTRGATRAATVKVPLAASESATRSPNPVVVPSTTTIRSGPPEPANRSGRKNRVAKKMGPRAADTQNHLLRTRSTNSRRMTAQTLRTGGLAFRAHYGSRRFRPHQVDEDLVQRRLHQIEPREPGTGGYESLQDHLRVCPRRELELGELPVVVHLLLLSLRQLVDPAQSPLSEPESLEPLPGPLARPPPVDAFHLAQKHEHVEHPHLAVQAALLREVADPLRMGPPAARLAE